MGKIKQIYNSKAYGVVDILTFTGAFIAAVYSMFTLCYRQATTTSEVAWYSDIGPYIEEVLGINETYNFPYPIMFDTAKLFNHFIQSPGLAMAIAVTIFNAMTVVVVKVVLERRTGTKLLSTFGTLCLLFLSMLYSKSFQKVGIPYIYVGVYSPNPWHNHTYMAAKPFMILAFVLGTSVLLNYEKDFEAGKKLDKSKIMLYGFFSLSLLLATMTKPSYTLVHMGTAGIIMLYRLVKNKFRNFRQTFICGCWYIPTIVAMLYQYAGVFTGQTSNGDESGIGIGILKVWLYYSDNIPLAMILATAFPFLALVIHWKKLKTDFMFRFAWEIYLMGLAMWCVLVEKGFRLYHGNFQWGYHCGLFFVFFVSIILLLQDTKSIVRERFSIKRGVLLITQWAFLGAHTLMGVWYFYMLTVLGRDFY